MCQSLLRIAERPPEDEQILYHALNGMVKIARHWDGDSMAEEVKKIVEQYRSSQWLHVAQLASELSVLCELGSKEKLMEGDFYCRLFQFQFQFQFSIVPTFLYRFVDYENCGESLSIETYFFLYFIVFIVVEWG